MMGMMLTKHMVNVEKVNQELAIVTMCHTENNEAPKIFVVSGGKDNVAFSLGLNCGIIKIVVLKGKGNFLMVCYLWIINYPSQILSLDVVSMPSSGRMMASISCMGN